MHYQSTPRTNTCPIPLIISTFGLIITIMGCIGLDMTHCAIPFYFYLSVVIVGVIASITACEMTQYDLACNDLNARNASFQFQTIAVD